MGFCLTRQSDEQCPHIAREAEALPIFIPVPVDTNEMSDHSYLHWVTPARNFFGILEVFEEDQSKKGTRTNGLFN